MQCTGIVVTAILLPVWYKMHSLQWFKVSISIAWIEGVAEFATRAFLLGFEYIDKCSFGNSLKPYCKFLHEMISFWNSHFSKHQKLDDGRYYRSSYFPDCRCSRLHSQDGKFLQPKYRMIEFSNAFSVSSQCSVVATQARNQGSTVVLRWRRAFWNDGMHG